MTGSVIDHPSSHGPLVEEKAEVGDEPLHEPFRYETFLNEMHYSNRVGPYMGVGPWMNEWGGGTPPKVTETWETDSTDIIE